MGFYVHVCSIHIGLHFTTMTGLWRGANNYFSKYITNYFNLCFIIPLYKCLYKCTTRSTRKNGKFSKLDSLKINLPDFNWKTSRHNKLKIKKKINLKSIGAVTEIRKSILYKIRKFFHSIFSQVILHPLLKNFYYINHTRYD